MLDIDYDTLRNEVEVQLTEQDGKYNWQDRDTNVRIVEDIRKAIDALADGITPSAAHIAEVAIATNENLQIRDFIMGIHLEKDVDYIGRYVELLRGVIIKEKVVPIATIFCGYLYQVNKTEEAKLALLEVFSIKQDYPLAGLLKRVFEAQWPPAMFERMAQELHPKVVDTIYEIDNKEIENDNN